MTGCAPPTAYPQAIERLQREVDASAQEVARLKVGGGREGQGGD